MLSFLADEIKKFEACQLPDARSVIRDNPFIPGKPFQPVISSSQESSYAMRILYLWGKEQGWFKAQRRIPKVSQ
jgi:hypothetical protein